MRVPVDRLRAFVEAALAALDVLPEHAAVTAARLVEADLSGRTGHGVVRLPLYVARIRAGGVNLRPQITVTRDTPVSALVDGDNGLGQVVMTRAVETAVAKAEASGMAWVGTTRSNHAGAAGVYTAMALRHHLVALYLAVASANVMPPWGGTERLLGTNPISIAIPTATGPGFLLDIATTVASHGSIKVLAMAGQDMPVGWVIGPDGEPITDPRRADEGWLAPIGGYKGSGLSMAIGLLAGVLNGAAFGSAVIDHRRVPDRPTDTGQSIFVMRPDLFRGRDEFESAMDEALADMRSAGPGVHIPGEGAARRTADQAVDGIPLPDDLLGQLRRLAGELGLEDLLDD